MGLIACGVALSAGEMSAFLPVTGGFVRHATKFVQPALGIATGWNFWYTMAITAPAELAAAATLINFWDNSINPAVWYSVFIVIIVVINFCGVKVYGEVSPDKTYFWLIYLTIQRAKSSSQLSRSSSSWVSSSPA